MKLGIEDRHALVWGGSKGIGFADAPATFRKTDRIPQFIGGAPNPEARVLGGE